MSNRIDTSRKRSFEQIASLLEPHCVLSTDMSCVALGDSLEMMRQLPDESVSLVLTDPPYHVTQKKNVYGDRRFKEDQQYLEWIAEYADKWRRILKQNGSLLCFCDSSMAARLDVLLSQQFSMLSHIVWTKPNDPGFDGWKGKMRKEALRQWYPHSERILFAEPAVEGNLFRCPFGMLLSEARKQAGLSMHQLTAIIGAHGAVNHGGAVSNWEAGRNTPSREHFNKMREALLATGKVKQFPLYEDAIRVFDMDKSRQFTDVWDFPSVRPFKGKHPAEKPLALLEHAIQATTRPGDVVLDCFGGSGSTAEAAIRLGRCAVTIEIEEKWCKRITKRLRAAERFPDDCNGHSRNGQLALFSESK